MIILGIDPGTARLGYGLIRKPKGKKGKIKAVDYGCIVTNPNLLPGERLRKINNELNKLIKKYKPNVLAVENIYFFKNLKTAMPVSQAKGVVLLCAAKKKIPVYEFTPLQVKMAVSGYGKAEKKQVQRMIKVLLSLEEVPKMDDAADALGVALCYILETEKKRKLG
jgi:crossover junction endodeoxyribonuclease RuvC